MDESEREKIERIERKLDGLKLELRAASIFLVILILSLEVWSMDKSLLAAFAISIIFTMSNWSLYKKYGSF